MATITLRKAGVIGGILTAAIAVSAFMLPFVRSDSPPYAGIKRVQDEHDTMKTIVMNAKNEIRSDLMFSRVFNLRLAQCTAIKMHDDGLSRALAEQISEAQRIYMQITGLTVTVSACSEL